MATPSRPDLRSELASLGPPDRGKLPQDSPTSPEACPECSGLGWRIVPDGGAGAAVRCDCQVERRGEDFLTTSGIPERYAACRLERFVTSNRSPRVAELLLRAKRVATSYVDTFVDPESGRFRRSGLLFIGPPGVGKTHLAAAVLLELIRRYRVRGKFVDFTSLLHQIKTTFDGGTMETQRSILEPVIRAEVLVLDELGAQKPTEWVMDNLYLIMNSRYTAGRPTLFTTNFRLDSKDRLDAGNPKSGPNLGRSRGRSNARQEGPELLSSRISAALVSRLYEMAQPLELEGPDYRHTVMMHQHRIGG